MSQSNMVNTTWFGTKPRGFVQSLSMPDVRRAGAAGEVEAFFILATNLSDKTDSSVRRMEAGKAWKHHVA